MTLRGFVYKTGIVCAAFLFAAALQVFAFTEPSAAPPTQSLDAPLTTSATAQTESGTLTVGNLVSSNSIGIGTTPNYSLEANGDIRADGWLRTSGNTGLYSDSWGGGWFMQDGTWLRAANNKYIYTAGQVRGDGGLCIGGTCMTSWNTGKPLYNCSGNPYGGSTYVSFAASEPETSCGQTCDFSGDCTTSCTNYGTYNCPFIGYLAI